MVAEYGRHYLAYCEQQNIRVFDRLTQCYCELKKGLAGNSDKTTEDYHCREIEEMLVSRIDEHCWKSLSRKSKKHGHSLNMSTLTQKLEEFVRTFESYISSRGTVLDMEEASRIWFGDIPSLTLESLSGFKYFGAIYEHYFSPDGLTREKLEDIAVQENWGELTRERLQQIAIEEEGRLEQIQTAIEEGRQEQIASEEGGRWHASA